MCGPHRRPRRGYTLLELLAVLLIIGLMVGLGMERADSLIPRYQLEREAGNIAMTLRDARNRAVVMDRVLRLEIDPQASQVRYFYDEPGPGDDPATWTGDEPFDTRSWSDRVVVDHAVIGGDVVSGSSTVIMKFWPTGVCSPVHLYLTHSKGPELRYTVMLNPLTGTTEVQIGAIEPESYEFEK